MNITLTDQSISEDRINDTTWLRYFDIAAALKSVSDHIATLPSDSSDEQYTRDRYRIGVEYLMNYLGFPSMHMPTKANFKQYIAHLLHDKQWWRGAPPADPSTTDRQPECGVSAKTAYSGYIVPARLFIRSLIDQQVKVTGYERDFVMDCKDQMRTILSIKAPRAKKTVNVAPLWDPRFTRLDVKEVNTVLASFDRTTLYGARTYAIFRTMLETGLRVAEIRRITLDTITLEDDFALITVRGKRGRLDPVSISLEGYQAIKQWVDLYNQDLTPTDPRYIHNNIPIVQSLRGKKRYSLTAIYNPEVHTRAAGFIQPAQGSSSEAISRLIKKITADILGENRACTAHDMRRTFARICYELGMSIDEIQKALRHADPATTMRYIGVKPTYEDTLLTRHINIA